MDSRNILELMKENMAEYSRYVATSRSVPSLVDGFKPSQRRSLLTGYDLKLWHTKPTMKSAKIEGDVIGNYHPHGGISLAGLIQPFTIRYPLFEGQGNWGSPDMPGSVAASRYTEARLTEFAEKFYLESVDYADKEPNYDGRLQEVTQFYPAVPGCLITGAMGIAVGLSTKIPTHNILDIGKSLKYYIKEDPRYLDILPDTCEQSIILTPKDDIRKLYQTGSGSISYKAKTHYETIDGKVALVVDAFPPGYNKSRLNTSKILEYVESDRLELINESKEGIRYVFLSDSRDVLEEVEGRLTNSVGYNMYIEHNGVVKLYTLKEIYNRFIEAKSAYILRKYTDLVNKSQAEIDYLNILIKFKANRDYIKGMFDKTSDVVIKEICETYNTTKSVAERLIATSLKSLLADNAKQILDKLHGLEKDVASYTTYINDPISKLISDIDDIMTFVKADKRKAVHTDDIKDEFKIKHRGKRITIKANEMYYVGFEDNVVQLQRGSDILNLDDTQCICPVGYKYYILTDGKGICGMTEEVFKADNKFKSDHLSDILGTNSLKTVSYTIDGKTKQLDDWCLRKRASYIKLTDSEVILKT